MLWCSIGMLVHSRLTEYDRSPILFLLIFNYCFTPWFDSDPILNCPCRCHLIANRRRGRYHIEVAPDGEVQGYY